MSTTFPGDPPSPETSGPQIGADEWVARAQERIGAAGWLDRIERQAGIPRWAWFLGLVALLALFPFPADAYWMRIGVISLVFTLLALGLNVSVGYAGLLDLGYIAYYGFGAYGYAMLSSSKFGIHWQAWASIPVVVTGAILLGFFLALPSRRLVGDYLAIVTLFFGQMFYEILVQGYKISLL